MTVRIDEIVTDMAEEPSARRGVAEAENGASPGAAMEDLDRLEHELERRCQRLARLWAD